MTETVSLSERELRELVDRMCSTALAYWNAADALGKTSVSTGPSIPVLRALAVEILLKALYLQERGQRPTFRHDLKSGFDKLSCGLRKRVLDQAGDVIGPSALNETPDGIAKVLADIEKTFTHFRYDYETYQELGEVEFKNAEHLWIKEGAPVREATWRFWPEEVYGLFCALQVCIAEQK